MVEATFIASGKTIEDALGFSADLVHKVLIGDDFTGASKKIDVFCNNIQEANQLDKILWERPKYSIISHNLVNNCSDDVVRIGYPGTKFSLGSSSLINLSPDLPSNLDTYKDYFQLVIMDGGELRERAATTWTKCKGMGMGLRFLETI